MAILVIRDKEILAASSLTRGKGDSGAVIDE
jgi:hypothetical protein